MKNIEYHFLSFIVCFGS